MTQHFRFLIKISEPDICESDEHSPFIPRFDHSSLKKCNHFCRSEDDLFRNDDHEKLIHYIQRYSTDLSTPAVRGQPDDPTYLVVSLRAQATKKWAQIAYEWFCSLQQDSFWWQLKAILYPSCHICNICVVEYPISYDINDIHALSFPPIRYLILWVSHMGVSPKKGSAQNSMLQKIMFLIFSWFGQTPMIMN